MQLSKLETANEILGDPQALAGRYDHDGCLLIRQALGPALAGELRRQAGDVLHKCGLTRPPGEDGPRWNGTPVECRDLDELATIPALTTLIDGFNSPAQPLRSVIGHICGHPMHLWRNAHLFTTIPDDPAYITRPHQDVALRLSPTGDYRRIWIALTHIPFADGGLAVALGSHRAGRLPLREFPELKWRATPDEPGSTTPVRGVDPDLVNDHWHSAEFHPGDALIFHSELLHRGLPATSDRIRIGLGIVASADTDPRPLATFTQPETRARKRRLRELATLLDLSEEQLTTVRRDLLMTGQPITETTIRSALAGDHNQWRQHAPAHQAATGHP